MGRAGFGLWVRARVVITLWEGLIIGSPFLKRGPRSKMRRVPRYEVYTGIMYETQYV